MKIRLSNRADAQGLLHQPPATAPTRRRLLRTRREIPLAGVRQAAAAPAFREWARRCSAAMHGASPFPEC